MLTRKITRILILGALCWAPINVTQARVTFVDDGECKLVLDQRVEPGDAQKFSTHINQEVEGWTFCLNSEGGSYAEAIKIIDLFPQNLRTIVRADHKCISACALIFLAGRQYRGIDNSEPDRWLHIRGELGFHSPYVPVDSPGERAYAAGVRAIASLISRSAQLDGLVFYPPDLLAEALKVGPSESFKIEWVHQAIYWNIRIAGLAIPSSHITGCVITRACVNYVMRHEAKVTYQWLGESKEGGDSPFTFKRLLPLKSGVESDYVPKRAKDWFSSPVKLGRGIYTDRFPVELGGDSRLQFACAQEILSKPGSLLLNMRHAMKSAPNLLRPSAGLHDLNEWFGQTAGVSLAYLLDPNVRIRDLDGAPGIKSALMCTREAE